MITAGCSSTAGTGTARDGAVDNHSAQEMVPGTADAPTHTTVRCGSRSTSMATRPAMS